MVELSKDLLFEVHDLRNGLQDKIHGAHRLFQMGRDGDFLQSGLFLFGPDHSMLDESVQACADSAQGRFEDLFIDVVEKDGVPFLSKDLAKPMPHDPRPDDCDSPDLA